MTGYIQSHLCLTIYASSMDEISGFHWKADVRRVCSVFYVPVQFWIGINPISATLLPNDMNHAIAWFITGGQSLAALNLHWLTIATIFWPNYNYFKNLISNRWPSHRILLKSSENHNTNDRTMINYREYQLNFSTTAIWIVRITGIFCAAKQYILCAEIDECNGKLTRMQFLCKSSWHWVPGTWFALSAQHIAQMFVSTIVVVVLSLLIKWEIFTGFAYFRSKSP